MCSSQFAIMDGHLFSDVGNLGFPELKIRSNPQLRVVRRSTRGDSASCGCCVSCLASGRADGFGSRWSCGRRASPRDARQIIGGAHQIGRELGQCAVPIAGGTEVGDGLIEAKIFSPRLRFCWLTR